MSTDSKPKSINELMVYLRDQKNININGTSQKRKLMNIGYYHGYKGYRYIRNPLNKIPYTNFDELSAVYDFDTKLKALFYPNVMLIETALKNYVLEIIIDKINSPNFNDIYDKMLDNYKMFSTIEKKYPNYRSKQKAEEKFKKELKKRLDLRTRINNIQAKAYGNGNKIADHYLSNDKILPIWGIFELLSLGEFGTFVSCMNKQNRKLISIKLGIKQSDDANSMLPQILIFTIKDLRNAIAHNDVIFDTRFKTNNIDKQLGNAIKNSTDISEVNFNTITDYLILIVYQLKLLGITKSELNILINEFENLVQNLRNSIPINIYTQIIYTNHTSKINKLKKFI